MASLYRYISVCITLLLAGLVLPVSSTQACECTPMDAAANQAAVDEAGLIALGKIVAVIPNAKRFLDNPQNIPGSDNNVFALVSANVETFYKMPADQRSRKVAFYVDTISSCGYRLKSGDTFFIFANEYKGDFVQTSICGLPAHEYWPDPVRNPLGLKPSRDNAETPEDE